MSILHVLFALLRKLCTLFASTMAADLLARKYFKYTKEVDNYRQFPECLSRPT